jgi:hypothetical protein
MVFRGGADQYPEEAPFHSRPISKTDGCLNSS